MTVKITARGAERWKQGHPWVYRSDVAEEPEKKPGIVPVTDRRGKFLGRALYSPSSEIRLRLLTRADEPIDARWWANRIGDAVRRRNGINATAWRAVHGEGDGLPSLIVDKYDSWIVAQLLSAGLETARADVLAGIREALTPEGILLRNDAAVRRHEGLPLEVTLAEGQVPQTIEIAEDGVRYLAAPWSGEEDGSLSRSTREPLARGPPDAPRWARTRSLHVSRLVRAASGSQCERGARSGSEH